MSRETRFWLVASTVLPAVDVLLVVVTANLAWGNASAEGPLVLSVALAVLLDCVALRRLAPRAGDTGQLVAGVLVSLAVAAFALVIYVVGVVAPSLA